MLNQVIKVSPGTCQHVVEVQSKNVKISNIFHKEMKQHTPDEMEIFAVYT